MRRRSPIAHSDIAASRQNVLRYDFTTDLKGADNSEQPYRTNAEVGSTIQLRVC